MREIVPIVTREPVTTPTALLLDIRVGRRTPKSINKINTPTKATHTLM